MAAHQGTHRCGSLLCAHQQLGLAIAEADLAGASVAKWQHESSVVIVGELVGELNVECSMHHVGVLHCCETDGHNAPRPKVETGGHASVRDEHLAVATKTHGGHRNCFDHGAKSANRCAAFVETGYAAFEHGDIGGSATDVRDDRIGQMREIRSADKAGRWTRQNRLDRSRLGNRRRHQRSVAAHHHQRCINLMLRHDALRRCNEPRDESDQASVEHTRQCPARPIELGRQLVTAGDWQTGGRNDVIACSDLVRWVASGELCCDCEARDRRSNRSDLALECGHVEQRKRIAVWVVAASNTDQRIAV